MREEKRFGEAEDLELEAVLGFDAKVRGTLPERVLGWPWGGLGAPDQRVVLEDESGAGQMAG